MIVFEDEVTPEMVRKVYDHFRRATGQEPTMLFPGAGGYWWRLVHRDTVAAAFKRTATADRSERQVLQFARQGIAGRLPARLWPRRRAGRRRLLRRRSQGEPLFVKLVEQGRIVYREDFSEQADRADCDLGAVSPLGTVAEGARLSGSLPHHASAKVAAAKARLHPAAETP